ncbi:MULTISPECIES: NAD(+) kinase [unclassified Gilliamella]|uniref:NAD(+) kinase n=1 Tax=unclassified Gilliamella TaxID=2685620 RepID=UPI00081051FD|nr:MULTISPECIES: NAD(+) kinase [Gilliamella]MCX8581936.1 NAD(+) kinase [Gilliamella sp. B3482]MCX8586183.1 NAD(+) kinase [Gilliamella sp. B3562]MCX8597510.1 NAD(+) kinase [Gilliamella sp. B3493]MCX8599707.1 NAD(+) kinase [Gilliamella sp. B3486]MCX8661231.1 NAD(+) kinase [Gilliamella sp. B2772]
MGIPFKCVGLVGIPRKLEAIETHQVLYDWLVNLGIQVLVEDRLAQYIKFPSSVYATLDTIGEQADLAIVVGGDGNMLRSARQLSHYKIKVIGVNRGNLGFLTDISHDHVIEQLTPVIKGDYDDDPRFLLEVSIYSDGRLINSGFAVNEIVVTPNTVAHMIDYDVYINERNAFSQRADGLIIATPTGSTAYSLSAGGPILAPHLDALIITPMFPHSLAVRPLVIKSDNPIHLKFPTTALDLNVACDSQIILPVKPTQEVIIRRSDYEFNLIHSKDYDYFNNLSSKLGWSQKMF